jgi:hypothetical protein
VLKEILVLIGMVSDPDDCFFFSQLISIRDHFNLVPLDDIYDYFKQLDEVLSEETPADPVAAQIHS